MEESFTVRLPPDSEPEPDSAEKTLPSAENSCYYIRKACGE